jgi:hypothetical protein
LREGFMAGVFESRHRYFHLNIGLLKQKIHCAFVTQFAAWRWERIKLVHKRKGVFAEAARISADGVGAKCEVVGGFFRVAMIISMNGGSFGYTDSAHVIDGLCIMIFLPEVFAQMRCELPNDYKYGLSDSIYRLTVGFTVKVAQQTLNVVHEQRQ